MTTKRKLTNGTHRVPRDATTPLIGELGAHTGEAASLLARLALSDGATEFGVGLGIVPRSSVAVAGEMVAVMPTPLPSTPTPAPAIPPTQPETPQRALIAAQPGPQLPTYE